MVQGKRPPAAEDILENATEEETSFEELPLTQESEEMDISEKPPEDEKVMIDFEDESFSEEFIGKKTVDSQQAKTNQADNRTLGADEVRSQISDYESGKSRSQTFADFQQTAEFLLNFVDMIWGNAMKFFAKDTSSSAYMLPKSDLRKLIDPLAMVLAKHSAKFAIEWIFIVGIVAAYSGSFAKAKKRRDELSGKRKPDGEGDRKEYVTETPPRQENSSTEEESSTPKRKPWKRKRGLPNK